MHELGITRNIVGIACEHAGEQKIKRVVLHIGVLAGISAEAVAFCFDVVGKGTACEGATLDITAIEGGALCRDCGNSFALPALGAACVCGSRNFQITSGEELKLYQIETYS